MKFADNLNRICKEQGTTATALLKRMGVSTAKVTMWNNGSLPKQEMLLRLAKELNCSVMDFFADEEDLENEKIRPENEDEEEILRIFRRLSRRNKHEFMTVAYDFDSRPQEELKI